MGLIVLKSLEPKYMDLILGHNNLFDWVGESYEVKRANAS